MSCCSPGDCEVDQAPQRQLQYHPESPEESHVKRRGFLSRMLAREAECSPGATILSNLLLCCAPLEAGKDDA